MSEIMKALEQMRTNYYLSLKTGEDSLHSIKELKNMGLPVDALVQTLLDVRENLDCRQRLVAKAIDLALVDESDEDLIKILKVLQDPTPLTLAPPASPSGYH